MAQSQHRQAKDKPWQAVLRRILDMAAQDQERIYAALGDMLEGPAGEEPVHEREMRARLEGVKAMEAAAAHLGLPEGKAPTSNQYKQAAREIKPDPGHELHGCDTERGLEVPRECGTAHPGLLRQPRQ